MAIDQTQIALKLAQVGVERAGELMAAINALTDALEWGLGAGISLANYDAAFAEYGNTAHVDGTTLNRLFAIVIPGLLTYLDTTEISGETYLEIIQSARRDGTA